jgi:hypothetical protein
MIKLKQVETRHGETTLVFDVSFPDETIQEVEIPLEEIVSKLKTVKQILGQPVTIQDAKNVIITLVNQLRQGKKPITERFDFSSWIGVDLEQ